MHLPLNEMMRYIAHTSFSNNENEQLLHTYDDDNNEEYDTRAAEERVLSVLSNAKVLRYALLLVTESIRNDTERYGLVFYNMSPSTIAYSRSSSKDHTASHIYGPDQQQYLSQDYNTEANAATILNEAEKLFNCINKRSPSSLPSLPFLPSSNEEELSHSSKRSTIANQI
jgi:hypothetical protein